MRDLNECDECWAIDYATAAKFIGNVRIFRIVKTGREKSKKSLKKEETLEIETKLFQSEFK